MASSGDAFSLSLLITLPQIPQESRLALISLTGGGGADKMLMDLVVLLFLSASLVLEAGGSSTSKAAMPTT